LREGAGRRRHNGDRCRPIHRPRADRRPRDRLRFLRVFRTHDGGAVDFAGARWKPTPERFEAGTPNVADAIALGAACDYLDGLGRAAIAQHDHALAQLAYEKLSTLPDIRLLGPTGERGGLVSFAFADVHAHDVVTFADEDGIALRGGHHCNQPLMRKLGLTGTTRASFYVYNTADEIDMLVASLRRTLKFFRG
jgi:cysteine desulfurase/selenocysteine lyase